jgi:geranylgeranyl diphosphate synthase, type II
MTEALSSHLPAPDSTGAGLVVPQDEAARTAIRREARAAAERVDRAAPMDRDCLQAGSRAILDRLGLSDDYLGFAMVAYGTAVWHDAFVATPFSRRLLLLPHCLRRRQVCQGVYDSEGLTCARCGCCDIGSLQDEAEALGYRVLVAEGTPAVVGLLASTPIEAILGVACLESLDKCFETVSTLDLPYSGLPLVKDGCVDTEVEVRLLREVMHEHAESDLPARTTFGSLLSAAAGLFTDGELRRLLGAELISDATKEDPAARAEAIALDWIECGGKRFRPFITLAAYAAMKQTQTAGHGESAVPLSDSVKRIAVAMELFHKASLVHDDVEDDDDLRYGQATIHARFGSATAINTGDYLLGLGYRLVARQARPLGAECVTDILSALGDAHVRLCRGQGAELLMTRGDVPPARPVDVLGMYALKTAPAFYAAMVIGMRMAGPVGPEAAAVAAFCRHMGVAYQILDDLSDLRGGGNGDQPVGQDIAGGRPTVLWAFAHEVGLGGELSVLSAAAKSLGPEVAAAQARMLYQSCGAMAKARGLVARCRKRAQAAMDTVESAPLRKLLSYLLSIVVKSREADADESAT